MHEKARIVKIDGDVVSVVPLDIESCVGCANAECKKNGNVFQAVNRKKFALVIGSEVKIAAPVSRQLLQAFVSVGIPVLLAVGAYSAAGIFGTVGPLEPRREGVRIGTALAALVAGMIIVYFFRRGRPSDLPEVIGIL